MRKPGYRGSISFAVLAAILAVVLGGSSLIPDQAAAIPAFTRRHKISCTTCHAPFPRLKAYGDEFAGNGMIIPEEEKDRDFVIAGDDLLRLNRDFPIAVRFDAYAVYEEDSFVENDLQIPWGLKLLSGGAVYKDVGYYFYFYMSERGEVAGIEDAYLHFNDLGGSSLDIMVGQFQTSDPLMKRELRLTYEDYIIYKTKLGDSHTDLTYDRGLMFTYGLEQTGTDLVAMVVNGNGKPEADTDRKFDDDKYKNFGFRVTQSVGDVASVGGFYYYGKEQDLARAVNEVTYYGPDVAIEIGPLALTGQYLVREDTNPDFLGPDDSLETSGIVAELVYAPQEDRSRHYFTVLYNQVDSDLNSHDYESLTFSSTYLVARNIRLLAEYTRDIEFERSRATIGLISAF